VDGEAMDVRLSGQQQEAANLIFCRGRVPKSGAIQV
jgi:hypothetical protein